MRLPLTRWLQTLLGAHDLEGRCVVDATAGNGNDTYYLAQRVGPSGKVHAFDIQPSALAQTWRRLATQGLHSRVCLHCRSHAQLQQALGWNERPALVLFNLGYLPGASHQLTTTADSTLAAIEQAMQLVDRDGAVAIVVYRGHEQGRKEARKIADLVCGLDSQAWQAMRLELDNHPASSPLVYLVEKTETVAKLAVERQYNEDSKN